jgi:steroid delta-isomerase-like uncharacterized protein
MGTNADNHRRSVDLFNARDWAAFAADLAADCEFADEARGITVKGPQQAVEFEQGWVTAFSDATITMPRVVDGDSTTVLLFAGRGTNDGPLGPLPASARSVSLPFCEVRDYGTDGKVVRSALYYDQVTMLTQLGHMPAPEA